ncbi:MAG TPA: hypothetical protein VIY48_10050 [Candidatus Paceibacterota bacterium]
MEVRRYLPSAQFLTMVGALGLSAGLVIAAEHVTKPAPTTAQLTPASNVPSQADWQRTLDDIQANAGVSLPDAPDQATVGKLVAGVQNSNLTDSVARSLFIKLTDAKAQGLGDDIPTQQQLVADATASLNAQATTSAFTKADLSSVAQNNDSLRAYGNKVMALFAQHSKANASAVLVAAGQAVDYNDPKYLSTLPANEADYQALAQDLATVPVPATLVPLQVQLVNDLMTMGNAVGNMRALVSDPLRGLVGLQTFQSTSNEAARVLTTIANTLSKGGILFSKDEPGASWSVFLSGT